MRLIPSLATVATSAFAVLLAVVPSSGVSAAADTTCTHNVFFDITHGGKDVGTVSGV